MSTSVYQGLQSCLEPGGVGLVEPRVLRLKLALPRSNPSPTQSSGPNCRPCASNSEPPKTDENDNKDVDTNGWSFLQALANTKNDNKPDKAYVHPMVKRSASKLSAKSLDMCTESLGSETGSDTGDSSSDEMSLLSSAEREKKSEATESWNLLGAQAPSKRVLNRSSIFPPPLASVSGSSGLQVRPHREGGRLVLRAVIVNSAPSFFQAERGGGRLRLRLMKAEAEKEEEEEDEGEEEEEEEVVDEDEVVETEMEDEVYEEENGEEDDETEESLCYRDMEGSNGIVEGEMVNGKLRTPSRCKEDGRQNRVLMNWEPYLVAT